MTHLVIVGDLEPGARLGSHQRVHEHEAILVLAVNAATLQLQAQHTYVYTHDGARNAASLQLKHTKDAVCHI